MLHPGKDSRNTHTSAKNGQGEMKSCPLPQNWGSCKNYGSSLTSLSKTISIMHRGGNKLHGSGLMSEEYWFQGVDLTTCILSKCFDVLSAEETTDFQLICWCFFFFFFFFFFWTFAAEHFVKDEQKWLKTYRSRDRLDLPWSSVLTPCPITVEGQTR